MAEKSEAYDLDKPCQRTFFVELMFFKANGVQDGATGVLYYLMSLNV